MTGERPEAATDHYEVLGVGTDATIEEIDAAYRRQARRWHPDVNGAEGAVERMQRLNRARKELCGALRRGDAGRRRIPPDPRVEPATIDFGPATRSCRHLAVTVRLLNVGGPPSTVRVEPEEGVFWSLSEVRGGEEPDEVAQLDFRLHVPDSGPGPRADVVRLFLDDAVAEVVLAVTVQAQGDRPAALGTAALAGAAAAAAVVLRYGSAASTLAVAGLVLVGVLVAAAAAGHYRGWPENWSALWPAPVWFGPGAGAPYTLHHHLRWPTELLPAGRRWTSGRVAGYAGLGGVGPARAVFTARRFEVYTGHRPSTAMRWATPAASYVYVPWTCRLRRGRAERTVAHQVGHLVWPPHRHDSDFFLRVQDMIDAGSCRGCADRLRVEVGCGGPPAGSNW